VTEERRKNKKKRNKHTPFQMRLHSNSLSQPTFCIKYSYTTTTTADKGVFSSLL
jgi:hypothetical protein